MLSLAMRRRALSLAALAAAVALCRGRLLEALRRLLAAALRRLEEPGALAPAASPGRPLRIAGFEQVAGGGSAAGSAAGSDASGLGPLVAVAAASPRGSAAESPAPAAALGQQAPGALPGTPRSQAVPLSGRSACSEASEPRKLQWSARSNASRGSARSEASQKIIGELMAEVQRLKAERPGEAPAPDSARSHRSAGSEAAIQGLQAEVQRLRGERDVERRRREDVERVSSNRFSQLEGMIADLHSELQVLMRDRAADAIVRATQNIESEMAGTKNGLQTAGVGATCQTVQQEEGGEGEDWKEPPVLAVSGSRVALRGGAAPRCERALVGAFPEDEEVSEFTVEQLRMIIVATVESFAAKSGGRPPEFFDVALGDEVKAAHGIMRMPVDELEEPRQMGNAVAGAAPSGARPEVVLEVVVLCGQVHRDGLIQALDVAADGGVSRGEAALGQLCSSFAKRPKSSWPVMAAMQLPDSRVRLVFWLLAAGCVSAALRGSGANPPPSVPDAKGEATRDASPANERATADDETRAVRGVIRVGGRDLHYDAGRWVPRLAVGTMLQGGESADAGRRQPTVAKRQPGPHRDEALSLAAEGLRLECEAATCQLSGRTAVCEDPGASMPLRAARQHKRRRILHGRVQQVPVPTALRSPPCARCAPPDLGWDAGLGLVTVAFSTIITKSNKGRRGAAAAPAAAPPRGEVPPPPPPPARGLQRPHGEALAAPPPREPSCPRAPASPPPRKLAGAPPVGAHGELAGRRGGA
ncbi:unnamed protein product [Prorocentrum cordatum]|uniref:Uncharacterized protein n=1 Tax=Prorocentrum cordatum TaxID=2364126 RepID=A0ABN9UVM3_9DINO|nr:unnamed protein product [Polarella glacialis]